MSALGSWSSVSSSASLRASALIPAVSSTVRRMAGSTSSALARDANASSEGVRSPRSTMLTIALDREERRARLGLGPGALQPQVADAGGDSVGQVVALGAHGLKTPCCLLVAASKFAHLVTNDSADFKRIFTVSGLHSQNYDRSALWEGWCHRSQVLCSSDPSGCRASACSTYHQNRYFCVGHHLHCHAPKKESTESRAAMAPDYNQIAAPAPGFFEE